MNVNFAFLLVPDRTEFQALLLARSIRHFGEGFSNATISVIYPELGLDIQDTYLDQFNLLEVQLFSFQVSEQLQSFPFAVKVLAAAKAEQLALEKADILVWMDSGSLVLNEPRAILLENGVQLSYRPVDHTLIGSVYELPVDKFWRLIFDQCNVLEDRIFPMRTSVDEAHIRPYFNAGMLVVRPTGQILRSWRDNFTRLYAKWEFEDLYSENNLYKIFIHQAVLAGTILDKLEPVAIQELPHLVNYPLHMHVDYPTHLRPRSMHEIITLRYEGFFEDSNWREKIDVQEPLQSWLEEQLATLP
jgi:hypothetical protein